jgi:hypothetical protein
MRGGGEERTSSRFSSMLRRRAEAMSDGQSGGGTGVLRSIRALLFPFVSADRR